VRKLIAPLIAVPLAFGTLPAFGQNVKSADDIIKSLAPTGDLTKSNTRGIRVAPSGAETAPTAAAPVPAPAAPRPVAATAAQPRVAAPQAAPTQQPAGPSINLTVNFLTGSSDLTPDAMKQLDELGRALASDALVNSRFRVEGHTDTVGSRDHNRALSKKRAEAVVTYITSKFAVTADRLQAAGMGSEQLLVSTPDQTAEPRNRRVQVINLGT